MAIILVADDDDVIRSALSHALEEKGHTVIETINGQDALNAFYRAAPELAILDVKMDEEMAGFDLHQDIRKDPCGVSMPIIFLTAGIEVEDLLTELEKGTSSYIRKPLDIRDVVGQVSEYVGCLNGYTDHSHEQPTRQMGQQQFQIGAILAGKKQEYKITSLLSSGNMGVIFRGYRLSDQLQVAIKTLKNDASDDYKAVTRFRREADATMQLRHPHLVAGLETVSTTNHFCMIMKYVEGESLDNALNRKVRIEIPDLLRIIVQVTEALEYLDSRGLVQRDIKPGNIVVTTEGCAVLVDMGICKAPRSDPKFTTTGIVLGTPWYLSPEQILEKPLDIRSDIYSLGTTFYHLIAGSPPFDAEGVIDIIMARFKRDAVPAHRINTKIPLKISKVISKMIEFSPEKRYQTPTDLLAELKMTANTTHENNHTQLLRALFQN